MSRRPELTPISAPGRPLQSAGGGGTYDDIETRVAVLETHVVHIREDIGEMKSDMREIKRDIDSLRKEFNSDIGELKVGQATLTERVNDLPSKGYIVTVALGIVGAIGAFIAFQDHIRAFFAH